MKKISHLGVKTPSAIDLESTDLESTFSLPQTRLSIKAPVPVSARSLGNCGSLECRESQ
jgi:hypothetical protein